MTDYIHPVRDLQGALKRAHQALYVLGGLLAISLIAIPWIMRQVPIVVLDQDGFSKTAHSKPWQLTISRLEGFTKAYLADRFEWTPEDFPTKRAQLEKIIVPASVPKLKDSLNALESLAKTQKARSYYVLEGWGFSNSDRKIEARIDRVIRIKSAAVATPLIVRIVFQEAPVSETNPYGLQVESLEESEVQEGGSS